jgi:hypothetical protein
MPPIRRRLLAFASAGVLAAGTPALTQDAWHPPPHVRPEPQLRDVIEDAMSRSPALRGLADLLEARDVTVYIRTRAQLPTGLEGRAALLAVHGGHRYLVIELACGRSAVMQMTTLGHELFHAVEIANEPSIVDARTLVAYYARVGTLTGDIDGKRTFETQAAADVGTRVRRELLTSGTRISNGT